LHERYVALKELHKIPGVGKVVALDLWNLGFKSITDLKKQDPEEIYIRHNQAKGEVQDICMLYTFRCAVYFADTQGKKQGPEKLKWWNWMDKEKITSIEKDEQIKKRLKI
jgi:hypothetical protein